MRRRMTTVVALCWALGLAGTTARAADGAGEIDDPKVARRLGARIDWPSAPAAPPPSPTETGIEVIASPPPPPPSGGFVPPRAELALRHFSFVRLGASTSVDGTASSEAFDSVALDVYPISTLVRIGLATQFGWQSSSGAFSTSGDYFAAQSASLGLQWLGNRVVPFAEMFGGVGYMRRLQFERTVPTAYFQLGVDVGADIHFARVGFVSVALGYLRPINGFASQQTFVTAFTDSWSFKLGVGL
jgi:hypothetical protein